MAQETNQCDSPMLCETGCGFFGSPRNNGMCSVCYKDFLQRQKINGRVSPPQSSPTISSIGEALLAQCSENCTLPVQVSVPTATSLKDATLTEPLSSASAVRVGVKTEEIQTSSVPWDSAQVAMETDDKTKDKKKRCFACRKKVGLTGFDCRCGGVFCSIHRYSDKHSCTFDYKADAAEKIRKENPAIVGEKIQKI